MSIKEKISSGISPATLAAATLVYFAAARFVQDYLYRGHMRPEGLFASLGQSFSNPEPYEIPLYFLGFVVIPVGAALFHYFYKKGFLKYFLILGVAGLVIAAWKLFGILDFSRYFEYIRTHGLSKLLWLLFTKRLFVTRLILGSSLAVFIFFYLKNFSFGWVFALDRKIPWRKLEWLFIIVLAGLVFHPNFPIDPHHYNYFMGPVNDIFHGKALLYDTTSLYGLFNIYFLLPAFKIMPFSFASLGFITAVFYFGFFVAIYYFLKRWLAAPILVVFGTISVYAIMFLFNTSPTRSVYFFPAMSPFRFWLYVPALFLIYFYQKRPRPFFKELAIFLGAVSLFWNFESGIALCAGIFTVFALQENLSWQSAFKLASKFLGYIAGVFALVTIANYTIYGSLPHWLVFFKEILPFGSGIGMTPLPAIGAFDIFVFLYLALGLAFLKNYREDRPLDLPAIFLIVYGIFYSLYYVGQSTWQNLYLVAVPPILLACYLFKHYREERAVRAAFYSFFIFVAMFLAVKLPVEFKNRDYARATPLSAVPAEDQNLWQDAQYIKEHFPESRLPIIYSGEDEVKLFLYSGKINWFDFYYLFTVYYRNEMDNLTDKVNNKRPPVIFIGRQANDQVEYFLSSVGNLYERALSLNTVDIYKLKTAK